MCWNTNFHIDNAHNANKAGNAQQSANHGVLNQQQQSSKAPTVLFQICNGDSLHTSFLQLKKNQRSNSLSLVPAPTVQRGTISQLNQQHTSLLAASCCPAHDSFFELMLSLLKWGRRRSKGPKQTVLLTELGSSGQKEVAWKQVATIFMNAVLRQTQWRQQKRENLHFWATWMAIVPVMQHEMLPLLLPSPGWGGPQEMPWWDWGGQSPGAGSESCKEWQNKDQNHCSVWKNDNNQVTSGVSNGKKLEWWWHTTHQPSSQSNQIHPMHRKSWRACAQAWCDNTRQNQHHRDECLLHGTALCPSAWAIHHCLH